MRPGDGPDQPQFPKTALLQLNHLGTTGYLAREVKGKQGDGRDKRTVLMSCPSHFKPNIIYRGGRFLRCPPLRACREITVSSMPADATLFHGKP